jgi:tripartite-type tricarboxylate transporter receptor subunit TctC
MITPIRTLSCIAFVANAFAVTPALAADAYPQMPITLIVPSVPGGAADAVARLVGEGLARQLAKPVIVENRPGGATTIGTQAVVRASPDGYTLLLGLDAALVAAPYLLDPQPYRAQDLAPIGTLATLQYVLVASPGAPFSTLAEWLSTARTGPAGSITYASGGEGSVHHLAMELLQADAGVSLKHVPYKAAPQGFMDVMGGHVDMMFIAPGTALAPVRARKVKGLGRSGADPIKEAPELAAISDTLKAFQFESWFGLLAPAGTPAPVIAKLEQALMVLLRDSAIQERMTAIGVSPVVEGAQALKARIDADTRRFAPALVKIKQGGRQP